MIESDRAIITDPDQKEFGKHCHDKYEFIYFAKADCEYVVEDKTFSVRSGDMILIPPGKYHFLRTLDMKLYDRMIFSFSNDLFPYPNFLSDVTDLGNYFPSENYPDCSKKASEFITLCRDMSPERSAIYANAALTEIFLFLLSAPKIQKSEQESSLCSKAIRYISEHISEIQCTDDIAKGIYSSRSSLQHAFRKNMDIPVMQYVRIKRLFAARQYILHGEKLSSAAEKVGFDDYTTFYRAHKSYFGYPPTKEKSAKQR